MWYNVFIILKKGDREVLERVEDSLSRNGLKKVNDLKDIDVVEIPMYGREIPIKSLIAFEKHVKEYPNNFINYCELLILPDGRILLAQPSHTILMEALASYVAGVSIQEALKTDYGWYDGIKEPIVGMVEEQRKVVERLRHLGLIK